MKTIASYQTLIIAFLFIACEPQHNYIVPADFNALMPDSVQMASGITQNQMEQQTNDFFATVRANTLNHEIPAAVVSDLNGKKHNLKDLLKDKSLIIYTTLTCGWNVEGTLNDFPEANQLIDNPFGQKEIILLILSESGEYFRDQYDVYIEDYQSLYPDIYLIDSAQALQLNMVSLTRYYISGEQKVLNIGWGTSASIALLKAELERNRINN